MKVNLTDIFLDFVKTLDNESRSTFDKYFLGSETEKPLTLKEYITMLKRSLRYRSDLGHRRLAYTRTNTINYIHSELGLHYKPIDDCGHSMHISPTPYKGKYPAITLVNYEYYTGIVFLLHPLIVDPFEFDILHLAIKWYDYSIQKFIGIVYPKHIYRYANKYEIYHTDKKLNYKELKNLKIYTNHIFGKEELMYE